nr:trafficking protein particle complex subunit 5 [Vicugna pacos]
MTARAPPTRPSRCGACACRAFLRRRKAARPNRRPQFPLQARLAALGRQVGARVLDALVAREKGARRETKVLGALLFVKGAVWKALFGKEADKLEQANDDARTFYIIEREPLINTYISVPKENSTLNCASFTAGIVEAVLTHSGFPAKVTAHWHKGTTLMIKFEEAVIARDRALEGR